MQILYGPAIPVWSTHPRGMRAHTAEDTREKVYSSLICKSLKLETAQVSVENRMSK